MDLLVVGANGLLGSNVVAAAINRGWGVYGTYHSTEPDFEIPLEKFDLVNCGRFDDVLERFNPDVVINCAAMTDVDGCEKEPERAHNINAAAPGVIGDLCEEKGVQFVQVSTDYVFDGTEADGYEEGDDPNPIQTYGESKLAGDQKVLKSCDSPILARLSFVWGAHRGRKQLEGFPAWVRGRLENGESTPLFTDQRVTPTRAGNAAETILDLIDEGTSGIYNVACKTCITPFEFGENLAEAFGAEMTLITTGTMDDVDRDAERPQNTCLDVGKVESTLGRSQPTLGEDLEAVEDWL